jgi:hypothetical protein
MVHIYNDIDPESAALIASIGLWDIEEIEASKKNKGRADAPLSDEQLALREQAQGFQNILALFEDHKLAQSIDSALSSDRDCLAALSLVEQAAEDDHQSALALFEGRPLPSPSRSQQALEGLLPETTCVVDIWT